jgi:hypothetical protein
LEEYDFSNNKKKIKKIKKMEEYDGIGCTVCGLSISA